MSNNVRKCKLYLWTADRTNSPHLPSHLSILNCQIYVIVMSEVFETCMCDNLRSVWIHNWTVYPACMLHVIPYSPWLPTATGKTFKLYVERSLGRYISYSIKTHNLSAFAGCLLNNFCHILDQVDRPRGKTDYCSVTHSGTAEQCCIFHFQSWSQRIKSGRRLVTDQILKPWFIIVPGIHAGMHSWM